MSAVKERHVRILRRILHRVVFKGVELAQDQLLPVAGLSPARRGPVPVLYICCDVKQEELRAYAYSQPLPRAQNLPPSREWPAHWVALVALEQTKVHEDGHEHEAREGQHQVRHRCTSGREGARQEGNFARLHDAEPQRDVEGDNTRVEEVRKLPPLQPAPVPTGIENAESSRT